MTTKKIERVRVKRKKRIRGKIFGTEQKPRLAVFRSAVHIYVQAIDDVAKRTLAEASTLSKEPGTSFEGLKKVEAAKAVGMLMAKRLQSAGIQNCVFDRGRFLYHGRVKALADGAREAGLLF